MTYPSHLASRADAAVATGHIPRLNAKSVMLRSAYLDYTSRDAARAGGRDWTPEAIAYLRTIHGITVTQEVAQ